MKMPMPPPPLPPPPAKRRRMPPPPLPADETPPDRSPLLDDFDYEAAVWIHGGYPQVSHDEAERAILRRVRAETPFREVSAASIWYLDRALDRECRAAGINNAADALRVANEELRHERNANAA